MTPIKQAFRDAKGWREDYVSREERNGITQELLHGLFLYKDGFLYWKVKPTRSNKNIGDRAGFHDSNLNKHRICIKNILYNSNRIIFLYHHGYLPRVVDHINRDASDDRIENLRAATHSQNSINRVKYENRSSKYIGVSYKKSSENWSAQIRANGKDIWLGSFNNEEDAVLAFNKAAVKYHGEFANLNILKPDENNLIMQLKKENERLRSLLADKEPEPKEGEYKTGMEHLGPIKDSYKFAGEQQPTVKQQGEVESEWIAIDETKLPSELLICEWQHPEYGIIRGSLVIYGPDRSTGFKETKWIFPDDEGRSADIALSEFTHWRRIKKHQSTLQQPPASSEVTAEEVLISCTPKDRYSNTDDILRAMHEYAAPFKSKVAEQEKEIENMREVFKWLMGYYDFPETPAEGRPRYYWRPHLEQKLKEIGLDIHGCKSPFQPRETDLNP